MRRVILATVSTVAALVLLLSFKTHSATSQALPPAVVASSTPVPGASSSAAAASAPATSAPATGSPPETGSVASPSKKPVTAARKTVTGDSIDTRWGPVQVAITVTSGKLTAVDPLVYPENNPRDEQINAYAIPALNQEALAAGSAKIDMVSGATYTSTGYINSLQSALDKAGL